MLVVISCAALEACAVEPVVGGGSLCGVVAACCDPTVGADLKKACYYRRLLVCVLRQLNLQSSQHFCIVAWRKLLPCTGGTC